MHAHTHTPWSNPAHLAVEVGEGADDFTDADEEERGEGGGHHVAVKRRHQVILDL